jgi:hypothetical protein
MIRYHRTRARVACARVTPIISRSFTSFTNRENPGSSGPAQGQIAAACRPSHPRNLLDDAHKYLRRAFLHSGEPRTDHRNPQLDHSSGGRFLARGPTPDRPLPLAPRLLGRLAAAGSEQMRLQSSHPQDARGLDAYFTPVEAVLALLDKEPSIPRPPDSGLSAVSKLR